MPDRVIVNVDRVSPAWLTGVLRRSGALLQGEVVSFTVDTGERLLSTNARMRLQYAEGAQGALPETLFLKMVDTDQGDEFFGSSEVDYYTRDYVDVEDAPLVRCYDAAYSEALGRYHVLMDDVSGTHVEAYQRTPTLEHGRALAEGLAAMHARWWGAQGLAEAQVALPSTEAIRLFVDIARPGAGHILAACADQLEAHWPDTIEAIYAQHPRLLIERTQNTSGFTIIHGDPNWNNVLIPKVGDRPIYIIDRQPFDWSLAIWLGVYDLAYAMVLEWPVDVRRSLEQPVLKHYLDHLMRRGVRDYSWGQFWHDYRLTAVMGVYVATEWCRGKFNSETMPIWLPMLQKSLTACDDLACSKLW